MNERTSFFRRHSSFIVFFGALYLFFLHPLILMQKGFTQGDYELQFYPWAASYAEALKAGHLLLWTPLIQCGFPLFAEGQTGMLYPLNLLFFRLLPFKIAYNYLFLAHFLMGGVFTYIFALQQRLSKQAATLAALSFTFGSAYAGCFYNIVTMRSLVWFPLALYFIERFLEKRDPRWLAALTLVMAQSWLGGFPQTALYHALFVSLYYLFRRRGLDLGFVLSMGLAVLIALPQLWATFELAGHSARLLQDKQSTLWGSVAPYAFLTLFMFPWGAFMRATLYVGIFPFLALLLSPKWKERKNLWFLTIIGILLSMGVLNYLLIGVPGASLLRNPAKFLFFPAFFLSILGASAFDDLMKRQANVFNFKKIWIFLGVFLVATILMSLMVNFGENTLAWFGEWYVRTFVMNKTFHRDSWENYLGKIQATLVVMRGEVRLKQFLPLILGGIFTVVLFVWKKTANRFFLIFLFILFTLFDLCFYGSCFYGNGFVGNVGPFRSETRKYNGKWLETVDGSTALKEGLLPNMNMPGGPVEAGAYSPLLDKKYYQLMKESGSLDDSFGRMKAPDDFASTHKPLLDFIGVEHLLLKTDGRIARWNNLTALKEYSFVSKAVAFPTEDEKLAYLKSTRFDPRHEVILDKPVMIPEGGEIIVRNVVYDPGWKAIVDGKPQEILRADHAFQAVVTGPGKPQVVFLYRPNAWIYGRWISLCALAFTFVPFLRRRNG